MNLKLVDNWKLWWKWASIRLAAVASALVAYLAATPEALVYAINSIPPDVRAWLPPIVGPATFALIVAFRIFRKEPDTCTKETGNDN